MPVTSVRDMVIHGDDLVAATYGRAFWILDDVTPLRQIDRTTSSTPVSLFKPEKALRARGSTSIRTRPSRRTCPPDRTLRTGPLSISI